jgi:putative redox protein
MSATLSAAVEHVNHTTSRVTIRTHTVLVDRGVVKGGLDLGPAGGEYMLAALGGCFTSHLTAAIRSRQAPVANVRVSVTGTMDGTPERFTVFSMDVSADGDDSALIRKLIMIAARSCQVIATLSRAASIAITYQGSPVEFTDIVPLGQGSDRL